MPLYQAEPVDSICTMLSGGNPRDGLTQRNIRDRIFGDAINRIGRAGVEGLIGRALEEKVRATSADVAKSWRKSRAISVCRFSVY